MFSNPVTVVNEVHPLNTPPGYPGNAVQLDRSTDVNDVHPSNA